MSYADVQRYHLPSEERLGSVTGVLHDPRYQGPRGVAPVNRLPKLEDAFHMVGYEAMAGDPVQPAFSAARRVYLARKNRYRQLLHNRPDLGFAKLAGLIMRDIEQRILDVKAEKWLGLIPRPRFVYFDAQRFRAHRSQEFSQAVAAVERLKQFRLHQV